MSSRIFSGIFVSLLLIGMLALAFNIQRAKASEEVYFSVEPVAIPPLNNINASANGLETPPTPSPVGQNFTVEIHLRNATTDNVPYGVLGVEVHFYFGNILNYCLPTGFTTFLGQTGGALNALWGAPMYNGFYAADGTNITDPPYKGAVYYMVAAVANVAPWNGADGLVANITFRIIKQPQSSSGETTAYLNLVNDFTDLVAYKEIGVITTIYHVPHDNVQGSLTIDYTQSSTSVVCSPNTASLGSPVNCTATVSGSSPTGTVTWSTSSIGGSFNQSVCTLSNGTCSTTYIDNLTGCTTIAASYSGDLNNTQSSGSTTLTVTSSGPVYYSQNYTSVQATINAAPSGANVIITPGFYNESLTINKTLTIIGEKDAPGFGVGGSGICLTLGPGASGSTVTGIEITNMPEGILIVNASNCKIHGNMMSSMGSGGIVLEGNNATDNVIFDNIFQDTPTPISLTASAGSNTIYGNIVISQASVTLNIGADGNVVYGNSISGSQILLNMTNSKDNVFYHNNFLATAQLTVLTTGNNTWDKGYPSGGNYWSNYAGVDMKSGPNQDQPGSDSIGDTAYVISSNNTDRYPFMKPWTGASGHCVAVIVVVAAKTVIGQGFSCSLTICAADKGEYAESFSVTAYANATWIGTQQISSLNASCQTVLTLAWNTANLAYGNYTVRACAQPVAGQTDMSGNDFTLGTLKVTIPGDIDGSFTVDLGDLVILAKTYNSKLGDARWNPNADIDGSGQVDLGDLVILAQHYNQHYP